MRARLTLNLRQLDALRASLGADFPELRQQVIELLGVLGPDAARTGRHNEPVRLEVIDDGPLSPELAAAADQYLANVRRRIVAGATEYGDRSFDRPSSEIIGELSEESEDLGGWGFILWERQRRLAATAAARPEPSG